MVSRRKFLTSAAGVIGSLAAASRSRARDVEPAADRPNLLFINTDDQAQWGVGAYGNSEVHTPVMDRLAAEGMRFTQAFTCPVCSPSRAMTLTGCYNHRLGIDDWIEVQEPVGLPANVPTIAEVLRGAGYRTALVGKWHLGHTREAFYPTSRGFDYFAGGLTGGSKMWDPLIMENGVTRQYEGGVTDVLADFALRFLRTYREEPFCLFFHPFRPHAPYVPVPEEDREPYRGKKLSVPKAAGVEEVKVREITEKYYASITSVDRNLGRLLTELERQSILDKTIIVFTSDNGYNIGQHGLWHKGNGTLLATGATRPNIFDTSARVPLMVRWPGVVPPGGVCDEMVSSLDHFPTLLEAVGIEPDPGLLTEGMSLLPFLRGERTVWRDELFLVYNQHHYQPQARMRMIRTPDWKLVHHYEKTMGHELYDLRNDPDEAVNLYGESRARAVQQNLDRRLTVWEKSHGAWDG